MPLMPYFESADEAVQGILAEALSNTVEDNRPSFYATLTSPLRECPAPMHEPFVRAAALRLAKGRLRQRDRCDEVTEILQRGFLSGGTGRPDEEMVRDAGLIGAVAGVLESASLGWGVEDRAYEAITLCLQDKPPQDLSGAYAPWLGSLSGALDRVAQDGRSTPGMREWLEAQSRERDLFRRREGESPARAEALEALRQSFDRALAAQQA
jgi:hypothetical protein